MKKTHNLVDFFHVIEHIGIVVNAGLICLEINHINLQTHVRSQQSLLSEMTGSKRIRVTNKRISATVSLSPTR